MRTSLLNRLLHLSCSLLILIVLILPSRAAYAQSPVPPHVKIVPFQQQSPPHPNCPPHSKFRDSWICLGDDFSPLDTVTENHFLRIYPVSPDVDFKLNRATPDPFTDYKLNVLPAGPPILDFDFEFDDPRPLP